MRLRFYNFGTLNLKLKTRNPKLYIILLLGVLLAGIIRVRADAPHRAGLVVQHRDGSVQTQCVTFSEDSISGLDVLQQSGLDLNVDAGNPMGAIVCRLDNEGCSFPQQDCFCQCQGSDCIYWSYWQWENGKWIYSSRGASTTQIHDGGVEGWVWGQGTVGVSASAPPNIGFDEICAVEAPTDTPIPPIPLPTPTSTDTPTPTPTITPSPTATPSPVPTATPAPPTGTPAGVTSGVETAQIPPTPAPTGTPTPSPAATLSPPTNTPLSPPTNTRLSPPSPTVPPTAGATLPLPTAPVLVAQAESVSTPTIIAPAPESPSPKATATGADTGKRLVTFGALSILVILFTTVPVLLLAGAAVWWLVKRQ